MTKQERQYLTNVAEWAAMHYGKDIIEFLDDKNFMAQIMKEYNQAYRNFTAKAMTNGEITSAMAEQVYQEI